MTDGFDAYGIVLRDLYAARDRINAAISLLEQEQAGRGGSRSVSRSTEGFAGLPPHLQPTNLPRD